MFPKYFSSHVAFVLLIAAIWACGSSSSTNTADTDKANKLVDEGNAAVDQVKKYFADADSKKDQMMKTDIRRLAEARVRAAEAIAAYDQAAAKCKEAASKYDEASRLQISDKFKQYLILKTKEFNKRAELMDCGKGTPQALIESTNRSSFVIRANSNNAKCDQLYKEAEDIAAQGDKIYKDNPDIFKKN
ncbi:MAG TPA: hypothetical protein VE961_19820 [Pyrinomonadaceae bacterium]|nr:hypothetical protein [Pyrinomonadaceae bacterium]